jgi:hypothetical protein
VRPFDKFLDFASRSKLLERGQFGVTECLSALKAAIRRTQNVPGYCRLIPEDSGTWNDGDQVSGHWRKQGPPSVERETRNGKPYLLKALNPHTKCWEHRYYKERMSVELKKIIREHINETPLVKQTLAEHLLDRHGYEGSGATTESRKTVDSPVDAAYANCTPAALKRTLSGRWQVSDATRESVWWIDRRTLRIAKKIKPQAGEETPTLSELRDLLISEGYCLQLDGERGSSRKKLLVRTGHEKTSGCAATVQIADDRPKPKTKDLEQLALDWATFKARVLTAALKAGKARVTDTKRSQAEARTVDEMLTHFREEPRVLLTQSHKNEKGRLKGRFIYKADTLDYELRNYSSGGASNIEKRLATASDCSKGCDSFKALLWETKMQQDMAQGMLSVDVDPKEFDLWHHPDLIREVDQYIIEHQIECGLPERVADSLRSVAQWLEEANKNIIVVDLDDETWLWTVGMAKGTRLTDYVNYLFNRATDILVTATACAAIPEQRESHPVPIRAMRQGDDLYRKVFHRLAMINYMLSSESTGMEYGITKQLLCDIARYEGSVDGLSEFLKAMRTYYATIGYSQRPLLSLGGSYPQEAVPESVVARVMRIMSLGATSCRRGLLPANVAQAQHAVDSVAGRLGHLASYLDAEELPSEYRCLERPYGLESPYADESVLCLRSGKPPPIPPTAAIKLPQVTIDSIPAHASADWVRQLYNPEQPDLQQQMITMLHARNLSTLSAQVEGPIAAQARRHLWREWISEFKEWLITADMAERYTLYPPAGRTFICRQPCSFTNAELKSFDVERITEATRDDNDTTDYLLDSADSGIRRIGTRPPIYIESFVLLKAHRMMNLGVSSCDDPTIRAWIADVSQPLRTLADACQRYCDPTVAPKCPVGRISSLLARTRFTSLDVLLNLASSLEVSPRDLLLHTEGAEVPKELISILPTDPQAWLLIAAAPTLPASVQYYFSSATQNAANSAFEAVAEEWAIQGKATLLLGRLSATHELQRVSTAAALQVLCGSSVLMSVQGN